MEIGNIVKIVNFPKNIDELISSIGIIVKRSNILCNFYRVEILTSKNKNNIGQIYLFSKDELVKIEGYKRPNWRKIKWTIL